MKKPRFPSSFRLTEKTKIDLKEIATVLEYSESEVIELLVKAYYANRVTKKGKATKMLDIMYSCADCKEKFAKQANET